MRHLIEPSDFSDEEMMAVFVRELPLPLLQSGNLSKGTVVFLIAEQR